MNELFAIGFVLALTTTAQADAQQDALNSVAQASYKQSGLEKMMDDFTQRELKHVSKPIQQVVGNIYLVAKVINEKKVTVSWSF